MSKLKFNLEVPFFPGYYESDLINGDTEYYAIREEQDYYQNELGFPCVEDDFIFDYERCKDDLSQSYISVVFDMLLELEMVEDMTFESITSPKYYNYSTDRLWANVKMTANWISKMRKFMKENEEWLRNRIHEDWSSRDGFWSWTDNDIDDWYDHLFKEFDEKYIGIMLSYMLYRDNKNVRGDIIYGVLEDCYYGRYVSLNEEAQRRFDDWQSGQEANKNQLAIPFEAEA